MCRWRSCCWEYEPRLWQRTRLFSSKYLGHPNWVAYSSPVIALRPGDVAHLRLACFTCLFDFRDGYGSLDHLNTDSFSDGFDYWSDRLFDPPRSFLLCRAGFGLGL